MIERLFDLYDKDKQGSLDWETFHTILYNYPKGQLKQITNFNGNNSSSHMQMDSSFRSITNLNDEILRHSRSGIATPPGEMDPNEEDRKNHPSFMQSSGSHRAFDPTKHADINLGIKKDKKEEGESKYERMESYATHMNFKVKQFARDIQKQYCGEYEDKLTKKSFKIFILEHPALLKQFQEIFHQDFWSVIPDYMDKDILSYTNL